MNRERALEKAQEIVQKGGGILLPWDIKDAGVNFRSRRNLAEQIADLLLTTHSNAAREEREACAKFLETEQKQCLTEADQCGTGGGPLAKVLLNSAYDFGRAAQAIRHRLVMVTEADVVAALAECAEGLAANE